MFITTLTNSVTVGDIIAYALLLNILKWILIIGFAGIALFFVIRATCKYQAKKNAETFDYEYLAKRIAEETCKRLAILKNQNTTEYKDASNMGEDLEKSLAFQRPVQNGSRQE